MFTERKLSWSVAVVAMLAMYACMTQPTFAKGGGHGGGGHHGGGHHGSHHAGHHGGHNHHAYHPSHHHHAHHSSHHHHDHHHYAHHHHDWHHGSWGPGFWGGAAVGYGLGYGYGNWGGWGYDGGGDTYVDNSTAVTPASDESAGDDSSDASGDNQNAATSDGSDSGFATDNWPELGIVTYAGQYGGSQGQVIVRVVPGSAAEKAGLVPGDVILTFNGKPVPSADDLDEAMDTANGTFDVSVWDARTGRTSTISGALDPAAPQPSETDAIPPVQQ